MFGDPERLVYQLHLLNDFLPVGQGRQSMGRVHRTVLQLIEDVVIDLRRRKGRVLMFRMARLTADFAPLPFPGGLDGGLTMSLDGGLEELREFFVAAASAWINC